MSHKYPVNPNLMYRYTPVGEESTHLLKPGCVVVIVNQLPGLYYIVKVKALYPQDLGRKPGKRKWNAPPCGLIGNIPERDLTPYMQR